MAEPKQTKSENPAVKTPVETPITETKQAVVKKAAISKMAQVPLAVANLVARGMTLESAYKRLGLKMPNEELL